MKERKYYLDWLRIISIALLLIYHIVVMYQSFAKEVFFIQSPLLLPILWIPMALINIMRIPLLFFISGIGVYFSMQKRTWKELLGERIKRILVPLIFGALTIVPIHLYIYFQYYKVAAVYMPSTGHLWFLGNIFTYVLMLLPLLYYFKKNPNNKFLKFFRNLLQKYPISIYLLVLPYILEAFLIPKELPYTLYFAPQIGFPLGAIAFLLGFIFFALGDVLWMAIAKMKYYTLGIAFGLYLIRLLVFELHGPHLLSAIESISWIIAMFGLGSVFLNRKSKVINYLSQASYPIYIIHMIFLYLAAYIIFPLEINVWLGFILINIFTFTGSFLVYEIIRRIFFLRPLFGMRSR